MRVCVLIHVLKLQHGYKAFTDIKRIYPIALNFAAKTHERNKVFSPCIKGEKFLLTPEKRFYIISMNE